MNPPSGTGRGISGYRAAVVEHEHSLVFGFRAATLVAAAVCALASVAAWRWMPAKSLRDS